MKYYILFVSSIFIGIVGVLSVTLLYGLTGGEIPLDYGFTIDAGSSHTTLTLYQWDGEKDRGTGWAKQIDYCSLGPVTGLKPDNLDSAFQPCIQNITQKLPSDKKKNNPIYFGATAGMRLLNISNSSLSEAILIAVKCSLKMAGFKVERAGILSGQEEGLFGWVTANFLYSTLQSEKVVKTWGALDLGGASTQISFSVDPSSETINNKEDIVNLTLYGREHSVESISYLCFGAEEIHRRYDALLVTDLDSDKTWSDPCASAGLEYNMTSGNLFDKPCTKTIQYEEWIFKNRRSKTEKIFTFIGTGKSSECAALIELLLNPDQCAQNFTYCFKPIKVPTVAQKFLAFSTYYYTALFMNATRVTLPEYRQAKEELCSLTWEEVLNLPASKTVPMNVLFQICFQAILVEQILTENGYGFNETTWSNLQFVLKVHKMDVGWALGYMVHSTNSIPAESPESPVLSLTVMIILLLICSAILILSIFFYKKTKARTEPEISYLRV